MQMLKIKNLKAENLKKSLHFWNKILKYIFNFLQK